MRRVAWALLLLTAAACRSGARRVGGESDDAATAPAPVSAATVPDLRGLTVGMARAALKAAGYAVGSTAYVADAGGHPPGTVVAQRPAHGIASLRGASVELRVAAGAGQGETPPSDAGPAPGTWAPGTVPVLAGLSIADATDLAHRAGYEVVVLRVPGRPLGLVLAQDVAAGKAAPAGTPLGLRVAVGGDGPTVSMRTPVESAVAEVLVPGVLDRTTAQAHRILEDAGLSVREEQAGSGPDGRVMDQRPAAGERVKKGTEISIFVPRAASAAPPAPTVPPPPVPPSDLGSPDGPMGSPDGPPSPPPVRAPVPGLPPPPVPPVPDVPPPPALPPVPDVPPTVPPAPDSPPPLPPPPPPVPPVPPESSVPPAPPSVPPDSPAPIEIPVISSPDDGVTLVGSRLLTVDLAWGELAAATGYVVEVEEHVGDAWTPILRKIVKSAAISVEIEPADPRNGEFRWRVRTVVGRRGGRAAAWRAMHVR